ncbi:MAG: AAA family ATPase [Oscillospiraceae bacterium]|nr:AAA family ATPase [Oscillospiraceae bacterium]
MLEKYGDGARQHFQTENAITVYLWLRYPDTYGIYKYGEIKPTAKLLVADYVFKKGAYATNIRNWLNFCNEIRDELLTDYELIELVKSHLTESCWPDSELRTLTMDVVFYISRFYSQKSKVTYLSEITEALKSLGGKGHLNDICRVMKERGKLQSILTNPAWTNAVSREIQSHCTDAQSYVEGNDDLFYSVEGIGSGVWGLRNYQPDQEEQWWPTEDEYSPGLSKEQWLALLDDKEVFFDSSLAIVKRFKDYGGAATCTQLAIKYGESKNYYLSGSTYLARRIVEKTGCPVMPRDSENSRWWPVIYLGKPADKEKEQGSYVWKLRKELSDALDQFDLSNVPLYAEKESDIELETPEPEIEAPAVDPYDKAAFLNQVYMSGERYDTLVALLKHRKNVILQGAPGVGKTFAATRLAWSMMGEQDESRIQFVQFHQNYAYEDFIMGYKPDGNGFKLTEGIFYEFCQRAGHDKNRDYFFIIDEINRGNLSKIFGELMMLIEKDYRGTPATLAYTRKSFTVPENIFIIGMMNTADRSLAMIDYALRRRFSFYDMEPGFDTEGFQAYQKGLDNETFDRLIECVRELNRAILKDPALGAGFRIGHSYFCNQQECTDEWMKAVVYYDILPTLREYWFDDSATLKQWENRLSGVFDD